jgi:lysyl-tRNA synthetase class 2
VAAVGAHRHQATDPSLRALAERLAGGHAIPLPGAGPFVTPALSAIGLGVVAVVGWLLLGPRRPPTPSPEEHRADRERARALVTANGGDTLAYFALRDDKQWFFTGSSVVAYSVRNGVCLVSPDPVGPAEEWGTTWAEFSAFAAQQGWAVAVVGAGPGWLPIYEANGMHSLYMGDEAIVDCSAFSLEGKARKGLRGAYHRVTKAGYTAVFLDPAHLDPPLEAQLRELMTETRHGDGERGFSMTLSRIFDPADTGLLLSVALDPGGRPAALCQWVPAPDIFGWSLDVMRRRADPDLPNGITDFVVMSTIDHVRHLHQWGLGLNFAVMRAVVAGEREGGFYELERRVLHKFSESMQIESLWRYNEKYHPYWRPRYVVVDAPEYAAAEAMAIADAESVWELPVIGRFLGHRS